MENVIVAFFREESASYQALSELKDFAVGTTTVLEAGIIKNANGNVEVKDGWSRISTWPCSSWRKRATTRNWTAFFPGMA